MQDTPSPLGQDFLVECLNKIPFFRSFSTQQAEEILKSSTIRNYKPHDIIIPEGYYDQWVYILLSGTVNLYKADQQFATLSHLGDFFGELAMIDNDARSASAIAGTQASCLAIDLSFIQKQPELERNAINSVLFRFFSEVLSSRLKAANAEISDLKHQLETLRRTDK